MNDVRLDVLNALTVAGISLPSADRGDAVRVCVAYYNLVQKVIQASPRRVERSRELRARQFVLVGDVLDAIALVEARCIAGDSLQPHFSDRALRAHTHDWLLNDWGIHHLHLSPQKGDLLLYVWVEDDCIYLLDVLNHESMADIGLLEIVLANWPQLLTPTPIHGGENPTSAELDGARRAGVQVLLTLSDGRVYAPRGGGVTTARGSSARAIDRADVLLSRATRAEEECRERADELARRLGVTELRLRYDPRSDRVLETQTGAVLARDATP